MKKYTRVVTPHSLELEETMKADGWEVAGCDRWVVTYVREGSLTLGERRAINVTIVNALVAVYEMEEDEDES